MHKTKEFIDQHAAKAYDMLKTHIEEAIEDEDVEALCEALCGMKNLAKLKMMAGNMVGHNYAAQSQNGALKDPRAM